MQTQKRSPTPNAQRLRRYGAGVKTELVEIKNLLLQQQQQLDALVTVLASPRIPDNPQEDRDVNQG